MSSPACAMLRYACAATRRFNNFKFMEDRPRRPAAGTAQLVPASSQAQAHWQVHHSESALASVGEPRRPPVDGGQPGLGLHWTGPLANLDVRRRATVTVTETQVVTVHCGTGSEPIRPRRHRSTGRSGLKLRDSG